MNARPTVHRLALVAMLVALVSPAALRADVKTQEKTRVQFGGALGKMMNFFGGKAARDGVTSTVAVRGDRMLTMNDTTGELVDLKEEKVYRIDAKKKEYSVVTFAELRKQMEDAMKKAKEDTRDAVEAAPEKGGGKGDEPQKEYEVDFSMKDTGQSKTIVGLTASEVLATVTVREKGKTLEQAGGMVMETSMWMTPEAPGLKEVAEFRMKYFQQVYGGLFDAQAQGMAQAMAMYPMMQDAMKRMQNESKNMKGTALATDMRFNLVAGAEQQAAAAKDSEKEDKSPAPTSIGGLIGGFGRKMAKKKDDQPKAGETPGRVNVMTSTHETLQLTPTVSDADVAIPAGFKEKK